MLRAREGLRLARRFHQSCKLNFCKEDIVEGARASFHTSSGDEPYSSQRVPRLSSFAATRTFRSLQFSPGHPLADVDPVAVRQLVVTASGPDRPGIVSRLSKRVLECGGNVEESRMCRLAGDFTVLMLISVDASLPSKAEQVRNQLLEIEGLQVNTRWATDELALETGTKRIFRRIFLQGANSPGLVYNVTEYLASNTINIESMETYTEEATTQGTSSESVVFFMDAIISMPEKTLPKLQTELDTLESTLEARITLHELDCAKVVGGSV